MCTRLITHYKSTDSQGRRYTLSRFFWIMFWSGMSFDQDFRYSFPLFFSLLKKEGRRKGEWIAKIGIKTHAFLLDLMFWCRQQTERKKKQNLFYFISFQLFSPKQLHQLKTYYNKKNTVQPIILQSFLCLGLSLLLSTSLFVGGGWGGKVTWLLACNLSSLHL